MADREVDWDQYLADFHAERTGVVEDVLSRAVGDEHTPYRWLARAVSVHAHTVVDLACGSGPVARELQAPGRTVVGIDLSAAELDLAGRRGSGPLVRGDVRRLPFRDGSVDVVTSSMGLVVVRPMDDVIAEIARVLRPGGVLAAIAPAIRPLGPSDLRLLGRLNGRLRAKPRFPGPVELTGFKRTLLLHGMRAVEDQRERYRFPVTNQADAELVMSSLYLPGSPAWRVERAVDLLVADLRRRPVVEVAIPIRRLVAIK